MTTEKPSIESLRADVHYLRTGAICPDGEPRLLTALSELESLRAENEALRAERDSAIRQAKAVGDALMAVSAERDAERARADALAARVEALEGGGLWPSTRVESTVHLMPNGETARMAVVPTWVLDEHDASVRREALEDAVRRFDGLCKSTPETFGPFLQNAIRLCILGPAPEGEGSK